MTRVLFQLPRMLLVAFLVAMVGLTQVPGANAQDTGSLTVLRMKGDNLDIPVVGVPIMINQVLGMDATSQDELAELAQNDPALLKGEPAERFGPQTIVRTNADGQATFRHLERGVYLVRENPSRIGNDNYLTATAFLVSVPTVVGGAEDLDVVVQTKIQPVDIWLHANKSIVRPGEDVLFWSDAGVPDVDASGMLYQYSVVHAFDPLLTIHRVARVRITGDDGDLVLAEGDDYTVKIRPAGASSTVGFDQGAAPVFQNALYVPGETSEAHMANAAFRSGTTLAGVTFTATGLEKLAARRAGNPETRVVTDIETSVKNSARPRDRLYNQAYVIPDGWDDRWDELAGDDIESNVVRLRVVDTTTGNPDGSSPGGPWWPWGPGDGSTVDGESPEGQAPAGTHSSDVGGEGNARNPGDILRDSLASTGASVLWLIALALLAVLLGLFLIVRERRREDAEHANDGPAWKSLR